MDDLARDLERLGEALTRATAATVAARRRRRRLRRRLEACAATCLLVFAVIAPGRLGVAASVPADAVLTVASSLPVEAVMWEGRCDTLHGGTGYVAPAGCVVVRLSRQLR